MIRSSLGILLLAICSHSALAQSAPVRKLDPAVEKLLRERVALLRDVVEVQQQSFEIGRVTLSDVAYARQLLAAAELELAANAAERVKIREALVKTLTDVENNVKGQVEGGARPTVDLKMARATRLRAEADLLTERKSAPK
jgi:outer membrane protein TolC